MVQSRTLGQLPIPVDAHLGSHHCPAAVDSPDPVVSTDAATQNILNQSFPIEPLKSHDMQDVVMSLNDSYLRKGPASE